MERSGIRVQAALCWLCFTSTPWHVAVPLTEDVKEEGPGRYDLLEAEARRFAIVGLLLGINYFSISGLQSQIRNRNVPKRRSVSTR
jgi:hypothetical protein